MSETRPVAPSTTNYKIAIVEDDRDLLEGLSKFLKSLGHRVRGFSSPVEFLGALEWTPNIDCVITDVRLQSISGLDLIDRLSKLGLSIPIILITGFADVETAVKAMKAGAADFISKPLDLDRLRDVVENAVTSRRALPIFDQALADSRRLSTLTDRQKQVLELVCEGMTSKEIAMALGMSFRTVETHRAMMMDKLGVTSLAQLIQIKLNSDLSSRLLSYRSSDLVPST
jgi:two-component system response regulator FixJ